MNRVRFRGACLAMATLTGLVLPVTSQSQVSGAMSGYVKDASGASVPSAKVMATQAERGISTVAETNEEGFYNFPALEPGTYTLTLEKEGFQTSVRSGLSLTVSQYLRVDFDLQLGAVTKTVTVIGAAPIVDTTSGTVSSLVDDRRIVDLPLNGRNIMSLAEIVPGVLNVSAPESLTDSREGPQMNVNGGRGNQNLYLFDGAFFVNPSRNTGMNFPPPDAVQEFRLLTSNFDAEYGRNSGSQAMVVARAGANGFHGDVWEFLRNNDLNARNFFASTVPAIKENQFGGTAGGPIRKDKAFFFASYQGLRSRPESVANEVLVPSAAERNGDFTDLLPGTVLTNPVNPNTGQPFTTPAGAPCVANNIIDPSCITAPSKKILQYVPESPSGTVVSLGASPVNDEIYLGRIDLNVSPKHTIFGHAFVDHNSTDDAFGNSNLAGYGARKSISETDSIAVNDTYTFSPTLVNQVVVAFLRTTSPRQSDHTVFPADIGINMPAYTNNGVTSVNVSGGFKLGSGGLWVFKNNNLQVRDTLTWIKGRHELKMGGEVLRMHWLDYYLSPPGFSFSGSRSGNANADFLLGAFSSAAVTFGIADNDDITTAPSLFFQDRVKATPRLTLTYGLRWEPSLFWYDKHNRVDTFRPGVQSKVVPDAPPGIVFPGDPGIPRALAPPRWHDLAPRVGFAWDVFGDGKTSVRGGYGVFFNQLNADSQSVATNPPFTGFVNLPNGNWTDPFGSTGIAPPPVFPSGKFGCVPIATSPGVNCPLFPLPLFGAFIDGSLSTPYLQAWNLYIQRQITATTMLEVGYVGNIGMKLNNLRDFNPARFIPGTVYDPATGLESTVSSAENVNSRAVYEPGIIAPYSWTLGNDYRSWYHSFQAQLTRRMGHGLSVTTSYTLAKSIDMCSWTCEGCGCVSNPFNLRSVRGRANFDRRHAFVASWLWSPPLKFSDHWKNELLGGWSFSGIATVQSGAPMTFSYGGYGLDVAVNGTVSAPQHAFPTGAPIAMSHTSRSAMINEFFNTNAFVVPTCTYDSVAAQGNPQYIEQSNCTPDGIEYSLLGKYGAIGRNTLSGPAFSSTDFAILKDFAFKERYRVEFRSEFFNVFNQVNFQNPDSSVIDGSAFGTIQGAGPGRVIQFGLKFFW